MDLKEFKEKFDPLLETYLEKKIKEFSANTPDPFIKDFIYHLREIVMSGGKRIRPYIAYLMYSALGGKEIEKALRLFVALEIFQTFALMHDDIIDKAPLRHSVKTMHVFVKENLEKENRIGDLPHIGNSQAILVGDLLLSWVNELFTTTDFDQKNITKAREYFYKMVEEVILGQMLDVDITTREIAKESLIEEKTRLKTSRYTFVRPMQIGAALVNPNEVMDEFCEALGTKLGIAFQVQDDLLDIISDPEVLHKNTLGDIEEHQHTFFTNYIFQNGTNKQKERLLKFLGEKLSEKDKSEVKSLFYSSGAIEEGSRLVDKNLNEAQDIITKSDLKEKYIQSLYYLIDILRERKS